MSARLILNADDFGLTPGINRAVAELHTAGALTSATLMANSLAFNDAVAVARAHPSLGIGCHIVLTDGTPICHPESIPSLIGPDGKTFRSSLPDFLLAVLRGRVSEDDIAREAAAQIQRLQRAGISVTHLDTHKHTHILPGVARPLLHVAERAGIQAIRNPFEPPWSATLCPGDPLRRLQVHLLGAFRTSFNTLAQIRRGDILTTQGTIGISATGRLNATTLRSLVQHAPEGLWEVVLHPGYHDRDLDAVTTRLRGTRDVERVALLSVFGLRNRSPNPSAPVLIHYKDLGEAGQIPGREPSIPRPGSEHTL